MTALFEGIPYVLSRHTDDAFQSAGMIAAGSKPGPNVPGLASRSSIGEIQPFSANAARNSYGRYTMSSPPCFVVASRVSFCTTLSYGACSIWTSIPVFSVKSGRRLSSTWLFSVASAIRLIDVPSLARDQAGAPLAPGDPTVPAVPAGTEAPPAGPPDDPIGEVVPPQPVTAMASAPSAATPARVR